MEYHHYNYCTVPVIKESESRTKLLAYPNQLKEQGKRNVAEFIMNCWRRPKYRQGSENCPTNIAKVGTVTTRNSP